MSNQKKNIVTLGYAHHGYPDGFEPKTVRELDILIGQLNGQLNNIARWERSLSDLLTMPLSEFNNLGFDCCYVPSKLDGYPDELTDRDKHAFIFTNRSATLGVQILVGAQSGILATRQKENETITRWTYSNSKGISYATFDIDTASGQLVMYTDPGYSGANFSIKSANLIVTI